MRRRGRVRPPATINCTLAECGDGVPQLLAPGEQCDDGNTDDDDGCASDCTEEAGPGTTGDTGDTGDTGLDDTAGSTGGSGDTAGSTGGGSDPSTGSGDGSSDGTGDGTGVVPGDEGCGCSSGEERGSDTPWSVLALFGLGAMGRRRRRR